MVWVTYARNPNFTVPAYSIPVSHFCLCPLDLRTSGREPEARQGRISKEIPITHAKPRCRDDACQGVRPEMKLTFGVTQVWSIWGDNEVLLICAKMGRKMKA